MEPTPVTLNDLECHSPIAGIFERNSSTISVAFLQDFKWQCVRSLGDSWASCFIWKPTLRRSLCAFYLLAFLYLARTLQHRHFLLWLIAVEYTSGLCIMQAYSVSHYACSRGDVKSAAECITENAEHTGRYTCQHCRRCRMKDITLVIVINFVYLTVWFCGKTAVVMSASNVTPNCNE